MCGPTRPADLHPHLGRALKALRRQVAELQQDNEFLGGRRPSSRALPTTDERYELMTEEKAFAKAG